MRRCPADKRSGRFGRPALAALLWPVLFLASSGIPASLDGSPQVKEYPVMPRGYSIPLVDLAGEAHRQVVVDREPGQYLGHPSTVLLEDGKTLVAVYPKGHGRGAIVMKRSGDGGRTWSDRCPVPGNWSTSLETPTIHRVVGPDGTKRLILFSGLYPARTAVSEDDGLNWTPLKSVGDWGGIVVMGTVVELGDGRGRYLAMFHDDGRYFRRDGEVQDPPVFTLYKTFSSDGGLSWSLPEAVLETRDIHLCEPGIVRSPDGLQLAALLRENSRTRNSFVIFSDDEGQTWSAPRELPGALTGDRHTAKYAPDGRLLVSFRDMALESPTQGDWVAWVGTYQDIVKGDEGQYRVRLMDNTKDADCAYPGVEVLPDGTFVLTTYGHWVAGEEPFIVSVRLELRELDRLAIPKADAAGEFETGKVHPNVVCLGDPEQSFALYLPRTYHPGGEWPVLFLFDPGARGWIPVKGFRDAAEKFGWILVGSNNSRNGPWEPTARACWVVWNEARKRFSVDESRVYAGGFSGGSRVASFFSRVVNHPLSGIIGCGAGLSDPLKAADVAPAAYLGLVGVFDFNYGEMKGLKEALDKAGIENRLIIFDGGHDWPPQELCSEALAWMEVVSMKRGLRERVDALIDEVFSGETEKAEILEKSGKYFRAAERLKDVRALAAGLKDMPGLAAWIEGLEKNRDYVRFVKDERRRDKREEVTRQGFVRAIAAFEAQGAESSAMAGLRRDLDLTLLKKELKSGKTLEDRALASRLLFDLSYNLDTKARRYYEKDDLSRARVFLRLAQEACEEGSPREGYLYVNLACLEARLGNREEALEALERAVDKGYTNVLALESEGDLASLRDMPEFKAILRRLKK